MRGSSSTKRAVNQFGLLIMQRQDTSEENLSTFSCNIFLFAFRMVYEAGFV